MPRFSDKREKLLEAAKTLIHRQGFNETSLADIAQASKVPLGNVYYYFKTKDDIASAVIGERLADLKALHQSLESAPNPKARLRKMLDLLAEHHKEYAAHGCPVGSLCQELNKKHTSLAKEADQMLRLQIKWTAAQFRMLGKRDPRALAHHYIATMQGAALLASTLNDCSVFTEQMGQLKIWLDTL